MILKMPRMAALGCIIVIVIGLLLSFICPVIVWDGGFSQVEFQITFVDQQTKPINGVTLSVVNYSGATAFGYPVTDYREDSIPTSDDKGVMVFHHVNLSPEYGGKYRMMFFLIPVGKHEAPKYTLHFILSGKEIAHYEYNNYLGTGAPDWDSLPTVTRQWRDIGNSPPSLPEHLRPENRSMPSTLKYHIISRTIIVNR